MALTATVVSKIKKLFLAVFALIRRAFCCGKRLRQKSGQLLPITVDKKDDTIITMNSAPVGALPYGNSTYGQTIAPNSESVAANNYYGSHSPMTRSLAVNNNKMANETQDSDTDYFKDMTPDFRKPKKVLIATNQSNDSYNKYRFGVDTKATIATSNELGVIEDFGDGSTWEDSAANEEMWDTDATFRDMRYAERERRIAEHQRVKLEKEVRKAKSAKPNFFATKIS